MNETKQNRSARWRLVRWILIGLACVVTLIAVGYTIEDIHGKRAWEARRSELEAQGLKMDWTSYIPLPIPDDQNFFKAPGIVAQDWTGRSAHGLGSRLGSVLSNAVSQGGTPVTLADLVVVPPGSNGDGVKLDLQDEGSRAIVENTIHAESGPYLVLAGGLNTVVFAKSRQEIKPVKFWASGTNGPSRPAIWSAFPVALATTNKITNNLAVSLDVSMIAAKDYLSASGVFDSDLDSIRAALKRPYAYMTGDYRAPYFIPIPNFVLLRSLGQLLANRTKCHLLLGEPDKALEDLTLLNDVCRMLELRPTGQPMTLVGAMINVAMHGLYIETMEDGFRLKAWQPAQLVVLQQQCESARLTPLVADAFKMEMVATTYTLEHSSADQIYHAVHGEEDDNRWRKKMEDPIYRFFLVAPRGWIYQNMVNCSELTSGTNGYDRATGRVFPRQLDTAWERAEAKLRKGSSSTYLMAIFLPNFVRAWIKAAQVQTFVNETAIVCVLERYRLEHGQYPETLDALMPEFIVKLPPDIIGGEPLKYRRRDDGTFLLYSIGWNEKDDGGAARKGTSSEPENGDWVWSSQRSE